MPTVADAVSTFGLSLKAKLSSGAISGAPEDQLRAPLETLFAALADLCGLPGAVQLIGETTLNELNSRPDYAVTVHGALVGFDFRYDHRSGLGVEHAERARRAVAGSAGRRLL